MLPLDDPRWGDLRGGYRVPYDASRPLLRMENGEDVWDELWQELHHQGDVDEASYASVPHLVRLAGVARARDWNFYGLVSTIEVERHREGNPAVPAWLADSYGDAWLKVLDLALNDLRRVEDASTVKSILGAVALARGHLKLGAWIDFADESEIAEDLEARAGWSSLYR